MLFQERPKAPAKACHRRVGLLARGRPSATSDSTPCSTPPHSAAASTTTAAAATEAADTAATARLEAWGADGVRVRVAPVGQSKVAEPAIAALLPHPPAAAQGAVVTTSDGTMLVNGNIKEVLAAAAGLVLEQTALV